MRLLQGVKPCSSFCPTKKPTTPCTSADREFVKGEVPVDWVDDENNPRQFTIEFTRGKAEVDDKIGKYLIDRGLAKKTKLIIPDED